jgi:serine phosphatase RsbU (regulator of sigma subunit)
MLILATGNTFAQNISSADQEKLDRYNKLIEQSREKGNQNQELEYINKAAFIYWQNNVYSKATEYFNRSLHINQELGNKNGIKLVSYYLGMIYSEQNKYNQAIESFERGIKISRELNMKSSIVSGLINLAQTYQNKNDYSQSNQHAKEALTLAKELQNMKFVRSCYGMLSENYKQLGDSEKSIKYFDLYSSIDKHIKNEKISEIKKESESQVSKAVTEKKKTEQELEEERDRRKMTEDSLARAEQISRERQMQLEMKELDLKKKQAQLKLEKTIRHGLLLLIGIAIIFTLLLLYFYRQKKKAYQLLAEQNEKINKQNIQIQEQKNKLEIQNTKLNDSINYAQNIQQAILPIQSDLSKIFETFVLYKPKDVVSGDFYWYTEVNNSKLNHNKTFLAVVDCTGHGVPGAFMSMIGNRMFNELINEKKIHDPAQILYYLNENIIEALKQEYTDNTDGMDVCLISIEQTEDNLKKVEFAGAKRPLYYYKQENKEIERIRGDRFSIGGINKNKKEKQFTTQELYFRKNDILYLTSDGIIDQVNLNGKRFSSKRMLNVLNASIDQPLSYQKTKLEQELENFKNETEQRDDITVIGAKII